MAVVINSPGNWNLFNRFINTVFLKFQIIGGSPTQCDIMTSMIKGFCHENHLPLYTFAEDCAGFL